MKFGWLTLQRRPGESFRVGKNIWIYIKKIKGKVVSVSVYAPNETVAREEVLHDGEKCPTIEKR